MFYFGNNKQYIIVLLLHTLDILYYQITTVLKVHVAFVFGLQTLYLKDFSKIFQLKGLKPKNKGHTSFYECCDLTEKSISNIHTYYLKRLLQYVCTRTKKRIQTNQWVRSHIMMHCDATRPIFRRRLCSSCCTVS